MVLARIRQRYELRESPETGAGTFIAGQPDPSPRIRIGFTHVVGQSQRKIDTVIVGQSFLSLRRYNADCAGETTVFIAEVTTIMRVLLSRESRMFDMEL